jgi:hypothetical protein
MCGPFAFGYVYRTQHARGERSLRFFRLLTCCASSTGFNSDFPVVNASCTNSIWEMTASIFVPKAENIIYISANPNIDDGFSYHELREPALTSEPPLVNDEVSPVSGFLAHMRKHSRIRSRNLSIHFPWPGTGPTPSIPEDGAQGVEVNTPHYLRTTILLMGTLTLLYN